MDHSLGDEPTGGAAGERGPELAPGDRIEVYRVIRLLGRGGMGEVYEVEHQELGTHHALKIIPSELAGQPGFVERFRREARVMANLQHPDIVHVSDFRVTDGRYWLLMELVRGVGVRRGDKKVVARSLAELAALNGGRIPQQVLAGMLHRILDALGFAHERGVVHRDLKPGNILLDVEGRSIRPRISDFGLVRLVGEGWLRSAAQRSVSASLGAIPTESPQGGESTRSLLGTYAYMSPEQKTGGEVDARSDLYAIGLMTARLLTGEFELGYQLPTDLDPSLAPGWNDLVRRAVHPKPEARYQTATQMGGAAQRILAALDGATASPTPAEDSHEDDRQRAPAPPEPCSIPRRQPQPPPPEATELNGLPAARRRLFSLAYLSRSRRLIALLLAPLLLLTALSAVAPRLFDSVGGPYGALFDQADEKTYWLLTLAALAALTLTLRAPAWATYERPADLGGFISILNFSLPRVAMALMLAPLLFLTALSAVAPRLFDSVGGPYGALFDQADGKTYWLLGLLALIGITLFLRAPVWRKDASDRRVTG